MTWASNPDARRELLAAVVTLGSRATAKTLGERIGKCNTTVLQMLYAMRQDRVVTVERIRGVMHWTATGAPLPDKPTSTVMRDTSAGPYDHRHLAAALGVPDIPPTGLPAPSIVHYLGGTHAS